MKENLIYKCVVGSQAYGTSIPTSDVDYKGIYVQSNDDILSFKYNEQIEVGKDECYYEVRRFLQLAQSANPTILEMLFIPMEFVVQSSPQFNLIRESRDIFVTRKCCMSFGGYAIAQIKKAKGLDKKMNWEKSKMERKIPLDFCYIITGLGSVPLKQWLGRQSQHNERKQEFYGVCSINHVRDMYFIYPSNGDLGYHGIVNQAETSNDLRFSSIPKAEMPRGITMYYNKDGYIKHCKDYREYIDWLGSRNTQRYVDIKGHHQQIDGKNILHCRRLLDMAIEIAKEGTINVLRPNAEYLLQIRRGEIPIEDIIAKAEEDIKNLDELYNESNLPTSVDMNLVNELLLKVRHYE